MIICEMVLFAIYLMVVVGVFGMYALYVSDLKKFGKEMLKEGVRFKPCPRAEKVAAWARLIISTLLPLWNLYILYVFIWRAEEIMENSQRDLIKRAIKE